MTAGFQGRDLGTASQKSNRMLVTDLTLSTERLTRARSATKQAPRPETRCPSTEGSMNAQQKKQNLLCESLVLSGIRRRTCRRSSHQPVRG